MEETLDTTTQESVETEGMEEQPKSAREVLMDEMDERREVAVKEDNYKMLEEAGLTPQPSEEPREESATKLVKVKVDGEEIEVPYDEVLTNYQKTQAADKRLRDAALERQQLDKYRDDLIAYQEALRQQQASPVETPDEDADPPELRLAVESLMEGDTDTAVKTFKKLLVQPKGQTSTPQVDEARIVQAVEQRFAQTRYNEDLQKANELFMAEYEDLNQDETLLSLVNVQYQKALSDGMNPVQAAKNAGDATRNWLQSKTGKPATVDTAARQERKQNLTVIPQANAKTKSTVNDEPDDIAGIIAGMRRGRPATNY